MADTEKRTTPRSERGEPQTLDVWNAEAALAFVRADQGEPDGCRWQLTPKAKYQVVVAGEAVHVTESLNEAAEQAGKWINGRTEPVPRSETVLAWGIVSPPGRYETGPPLWLSTATPWNGRGNGEEPDREYSVELVAVR